MKAVRYYIKGMPLMEEGIYNNCLKTLSEAKQYVEDNAEPGFKSSIYGQDKNGNHVSRTRFEVAGDYSVKFGRTTAE